jgi:hypothetical protein
MIAPSNEKRTAERMAPKKIITLAASHAPLLHCRFRSVLLSTKRPKLPLAETAGFSLSAVHTEAEWRRDRGPCGDHGVPLQYCLLAAG